MTNTMSALIKCALILLLICDTIVAQGKTVNSEKINQCYFKNKNYIDFLLCNDWVTNKKPLNEVFSNYAWSSEDDPRMLLHYLDINTDTTPPISNKDVWKGFPNELAAFSEAYFNFRSGYVGRAKKSFVELMENEEWRAWGLVGLFELALYVENLEEIPRLISDAEKVLKKQYQSYIDYYKVLHAYYSGDLFLLKELINEDRIRAVPPPLAAAIKTTFFIRNDQLKLAETILKMAISEYGETNELTAAMAEFLMSNNGLIASIRYLEERYELTKSQEVLEQLVFYLILAKSEQDHIRAISYIEEVLFDSSDLRTKLLFANFEHDLSEGLSQTFNKKLAYINQLGDKPREFLQYNLLMAKLGYSAKHKYSYMYYKDKIIQMAPLNSDVLWFLYSVALDQRRFNDAAEIIKKILQIDPYGELTLMHAVGVNSSLSNWKEVISLTDRFLNANRHFNNNSKKIMNKYALDAKTKLNKGRLEGS